MKLEIINPITSPLWQNLIDHKHSDVFHSVEWLSVLEKSYNWTPQAHVLLDSNGDPQAGFAYFSIEDFRGRRYISLPFSDFCDPLAKDLDSWKQLVDGLIEQQLPIRMRCLHNDVPLQDERFKQTNRAKWHSVDLQREEDEIWSSIHSSARRAIRKAQNHGVTIEFRNDEDALKAFFNLHLGIRKYKYRLLPQPYEFFRNIWEQFLSKQHGTLALAMFEGEVVGCTLFLEWKDTLYYKFSTSDLGQLTVRPTDLIIWETILFAQQKGLNIFDFGLSDWDQEGLLRFKRKYATEEKTISFLTHDPTPTPSPEIQQVQKLFGNLTGLLTEDDVPDETTARAGDLLYRFFI